MNEATRRPNGPYLIESSRNYGKRRACLLLQRLLLLPVTVVVRGDHRILRRVAPYARRHAELVALS